jgi:cytochrome c
MPRLPRLGARHAGGVQACTACSGAPGALDDFRFSPALKRSGITWTPQTLDAYIADPQQAVPANRMPYAGMPEARDRADLIAYLLQAFK